MTSPSSTRVTVRQQQLRTRQQEQVLAWACETLSGRLRYILELGEHERGDACGCSCISCGHALQAVNAANALSDVQMRPHFRHESGAETQRCHVLFARAALLASLQEGDLIVLPRLRRAVTFHGLSGTPYQGWILVPQESVRIGQLRFTDTTTPEVFLDDGRRLKVVVTGSFGRSDMGQDDSKLARHGTVTACAHTCRANVRSAVAASGFCLVVAGATGHGSTFCNAALHSAIDTEFLYDYAFC